MKKSIIAITLLGASILSAGTYNSNGEYTAESKTNACSVALNLAKQNAMEQSGTLVFSKLDSTTSDSNGDVEKKVKDKLSTISLGFVKLIDKDEAVTPTKDYQFTCKVDASFSIDEGQMKEQVEAMLEKDEKESSISGYFEAEGYSEEGQSKYKAMTAAKVVAQRNLLEVIQGSDLTSLTKVEDGLLASDKIGTLISGTIRSAQVVKQEYDAKSRSGYIVMRIKKADIAEALEASINQ